MGSGYGLSSSSAGCFRVDGGSPLSRIIGPLTAVLLAFSIRGCPPKADRTWKTLEFDQVSLLIAFFLSVSFRRTAPLSFQSRKQSQPRGPPIGTMASFRAASRVASQALRRNLTRTAARASYRLPLALNGSASGTGTSTASSRRFHSTSLHRKSSAPVPRPVPLSRLTDSFLDGTSSMYLQELRRAWEADPSSVDESWDNFFRNFVCQAATSPEISGQTIQREHAAAAHGQGLPGERPHEARARPTQAGGEGRARTLRYRREVMLAWSTHFKNFLGGKCAAAKRFGLEGGGRR